MKTERLLLTRHAARFRDGVGVEAVELPALGPHDVLIRNRFAGLNGLFDTVCVGRLAVPTG